jgi:hypothetical protein
MATVNKRNQTLYARGTLYETAQVRAWKLEFDTALTASTVDGAGVVTRGTIADVAEEFGTTAMLFQPSADGTTMVIVGDSHALDAAIIKRRAEHVLASNTVTVAAITSFIGITQ